MVFSVRHGRHAIEVRIMASAFIDVRSSDDEDATAAPAPADSTAPAAPPDSMNAQLNALRKAREAREKKRPRDESGAATPRKTPDATPQRDLLFLLAPGAGGQMSISGGLSDILRQAPAPKRVSIAAVSAPNWGMHGNPTSNATKVEEAVARAAPGATIHLVGHSYGCRVLVEYIRKHCTSSGRHGDVARRGAILLGYPLYATRGKTDRVTPLQTLPADTPPLSFVSGRMDEFIKKSEACLREAVAKMACRSHASRSISPTAATVCTMARR
jgi:hypothetical protein